MQPTLDQSRAKHAWSAVSRLKGQFGAESEQAKNYNTEARRLPARIHTAGLGQAMAFLRAKERKKHGLDLLTGNISSWVLGQIGMPAGVNAHGQDNLLNCIVEGDSSYLRLATAETLSYLNWLKRFLEAEIEAEDA